MKTKLFVYTDYYYIKTTETFMYRFIISTLSYNTVVYQSNFEYETEKEAQQKGDKYFEDNYK